METPVHTLNNLFAQLGRPSDDVAIALFIETYRQLASDVPLHEASFWTSAQANFLRQALTDDSDWAVIVEELNAELHGHE